MKKILITGIFGQDGTILASILNKNYKIYGTYRTNTKKRKKNFKNVKYIKINLFNKYEVFEKLEKLNLDCVVHLGSSNPNYKELKKRDFYKKNLLATQNLISFIKEKNIKFIFPGTSQMYKPSIKKINERTILKTSNSYSKFRVKAHKYLMKIKKKNNLNATSVILFNHDSKYRSNKFLLPRIITAIKNKNIKFIRYIFNQNIVGDFSHAQDICNAIYLLIKLKKNPDIVFLSSNKKTKINDLIKYIIKKKKIKINLSNFQQKKQRKKLLIGNNSLAKKMLHWVPNKTAFDAIEDIYDYTE